MPSKEGISSEQCHKMDACLFYSFSLKLMFMGAYRSVQGAQLCSCLQSAKKPGPCAGSFCSVKQKELF